MKKIVAVCGSGLGSSFMVELNIKSILKELNITNIEVSHTSVSECFRESDTLYVCGLDLESSVSQFGECISFNNIMDKKEIKEKLEAYFQK